MKRFKNILYVSDSDSPEDAAIDRAVALSINNQAGLSVLSVLPAVTGAIGLPPGGKLLDDVQGNQIDTERIRLQALVAGRATPEPIKTTVVVGKSFIEIIHAVLTDQYDLVIKLATSPDALPRLFGSDDMHLLRKCPCPVWLLKPAGRNTFRQIMVAVDFDVPDHAGVAAGANPDLLQLAASLAIAETASLHVLHVWEAPDAALIQSWSDNPETDSRVYLDNERRMHEQGMLELQSTLRKLIGEAAFNHLETRFHLVEGRPAIEIPTQAAQLAADLVVMGTVARTGIPGFIIGNTAEDVFSQLACSLLAIKPPGFVSPVTL